MFKHERLNRKLKINLKSTIWENFGKNIKFEAMQQVH
jgi:hypothetical protein